MQTVLQREKNTRRECPEGKTKTQNANINLFMPLMILLILILAVATPLLVQKEDSISEIRIIEFLEDLSAEDTFSEKMIRAENPTQSSENTFSDDGCAMNT